MDRRTFITATAGAGYALAVSPITASAFTTPSDGLATGDVKIATGKEQLPAYFAHPAGKGDHPVVIVVHEIFGVHEYIRDVCRRLAKEGYFAIAPDLFFRYGDASKVEDMDKLRATIVSKSKQSEVLGDLDAFVAWLGSQKPARAAAVGITGFCWGGNVVWMYAAHNPKLKAGVAWYGRLVGDKTPAQPRFPVDEGASLKVPVLGLYGGKDKGITQESVEQMRKELAKGKTGSKIIVYPDSEHAFHADYRPSYNEKDAKEGWKELLAWYRSHGLK
jgi:carboxymethylenebutenolidase